jgi:hypothetical protein
VPRRKQDDDDDMPPRRRRGATAAAIEAETVRSVLLRRLLHSPRDLVAGLVAFAAVSAIIANALFLQAGPHPAPMFAAVRLVGSPAPITVLPRPRPADADIVPQESRSVEPRLVEPRSLDKSLDKSLDRSSDRTADAMGNLVKATTNPASASSPAVLRPPAPIPPPSRAETTQSVGSRRVAAVQRALTEYGYGQLKASGTVGADTQAAIQKFERERRIPVTGQVSDRLVRELSAVIGHSVE